MRLSREIVSTNHLVGYVINVYLFLLTIKSCEKADDIDGHETINKIMEIL